MNTQQEIDFNRIAKAILYLRNNFEKQPSLDEVAAHIHLSTAHFQRMFTDWVGTSPKKFLQYINLSFAKELLKRNTLSETTYALGLSSTSRLHELFIKIEGMTPSEYKNEGQNLQISYSYSDSLFGKIIIASTAKGICHLAFEDTEEIALQHLIERFPQANFQEEHVAMHTQAKEALNPKNTAIKELKLHIKGTPFQLKVWEALLKIPMGTLNTYGDIAKQINHENAFRAVGTAIGKNPIAYLIPCHRVIQNSGVFGGYRWDPIRKTAILGWEITNTQL